MKKVFFLLSFIPLFSNEFVINKPLASTSETRATLRERIVCCAGDLLDNACLCIRKEIKNVQGNSDESFCKQIDLFVELQQKFLSMIREILDQQKCWKRVARSKLQKLNDFLSELNEKFFDEHNFEWWKRQRDQLKKMIPHS
jgi:hypothetical protein